MTRGGECIKKKILIPVLCVLLGGILSLFSFISESKDRTRVTTLERPKIGERSREYELEAVYGEIVNDVTVKVNEKDISFEEAMEIFEKSYEEIMRLMKEKNGDLNKVSGDLYLPTTVCEGIPKLEWYSDNVEYIEDNGELTQRVYGELPDEGLVVDMEVRLSVQDYAVWYHIPVYLAEENITKKADMEKLIEDKLLLAEENDKNDHIELPSEVNSIQVSYYEKKEKKWWEALFLGVLAAMVTVLLPKYKAEREDKKRKRELELSFSTIITEFTLLVGAGATTRFAWEKIVRDYRSSGKKKVPYEEMARAYNEMQNGLAEKEAYVQFGKRCGLSPYIRFGNLLEQNLRRGTKGLVEGLEHEVWEAFEERKALIVKLGEEAGTKLLLPMILLLGIVIAISIIPAFLIM